VDFLNSFGKDGREIKLRLIVDELEEEEMKLVVMDVEVGSQAEELVACKAALFPRRSSSRPFSLSPLRRTRSLNLSSLSSLPTSPRIRSCSSLRWAWGPRSC